jgi:RimJ/RimL family protein N-acetyltransferase
MIFHKSIKHHFTFPARIFKSSWIQLKTQVFHVMARFKPLPRSPEPMMYIRNAHSFPEDARDASYRSVTPALPSGITKTKVNVKNVAHAIDVFMTALKQRHAASFSQSELADIKNKLMPFLLNTDHSYIYYKYGSPIAMIGLARDYFHPMLQKKVNHVGAIGYIHEYLNREEAHSLTDDWLDVIKSREHDCPLTTARIHEFNHESRRLFAKWGFILIKEFEAREASTDRDGRQRR